MHWSGTTYRLALWVDTVMRLNTCGTREGADWLCPQEVTMNARLLNVAARSKEQGSSSTPISRFEAPTIGGNLRATRKPVTIA